MTKCESILLFFKFLFLLCVGDYCYFTQFIMCCLQVNLGSSYYRSRDLLLHYEVGLVKTKQRSFMCSELTHF